MQSTATPRKLRPDSYRKVLDSRKRRVRGLWQRGASGHCPRLLPLPATEERGEGRGEGQSLPPMALLSPTLSSLRGRRGSPQATNGGSVKIRSWQRNGHYSANLTVADDLRFLQFSGARCNEALRVRWQDVDFDRGHVTIGAEGDAKIREARHVGFNSNLSAHLKHLASRRQPDSQWLFPSRSESAGRMLQSSFDLTDAARAEITAQP